MISKAPEFTHSDPDAGPASVFLCYLGDAEICIWIMFSLTFVAGGQIELIKRSWSGANSGLQQICTTLGILAAIFWVPIYWIWSSPVMTVVWCLMMLIVFVSFATTANCISYWAKINASIAIAMQQPAQVTEVQLENGQKIHVQQNNALNLGSAKRHIMSLIIANFGIWACSVAYVVLMFTCSIEHYFW
ncbi:Oidioi.mRNA.OKI2018_I69.PAR.g9430.t1.cds [Oikopleura dioica]|uniref:Oidioi.mRNA.OKI2018_I69.PAR.g9430.t1.cds n=1 Tax=Oikopleura dioica TaxID=34765 RepID=A0ABN7RPP2_OIKDI|nr:Oidioi.mRNA.OKI2018_I69.PAR.g9430.t1.cds [Oikopleura dioica]